MTTPDPIPFEWPISLDAIPSPPHHFVPSNAAPPRGLLPIAFEMAVIDDAMSELRESEDLHEILGPTIPPRLLVVEVVKRAAHWSAVRAKLRAYDEYCRHQEQRDWTRLRELMGRMRPLLDFALQQNRSLLVRFSSLSTFLNARREVARCAAATRKANAAAKQSVQSRAESLPVPPAFPDDEGCDDNF